MTKSGAHGFDTGTSYVVEGVLLGERPSGCLGVGTQRERFGIFGIELLDNLGPKHTSCTHFGYFHEVVHADGPEEGQTGREGIDIHACVYSGTEVFETICEGICQLDVAGGTGFLHVVA